MLIREKHRIDASGKILGRLATEIAVLLRGKHKLGFVLNNDLGDFVDVYNADKIRVTGKKMTQKMYYTHSTYPGGLTETSFEKMLKTHPERIIEQAVKNMLPDNRLRAQWMKRLNVTTGTLKNLEITKTEETN